MKYWWNLCKRQDSESCDHFDQEWKYLLAFIQSRQDSINEKNYRSVQLFLQTLYEKKEQWGARWTWKYLTLDAHSTQRSESLHSSIKHFLTSHTLLTHLARKIDEHRQTISDQNEGRVTRLALKMASSSTKHPIERNIKLTPFALEIVKAQVAQCMQYSVANIYNSEECVYEVKYIAGDANSGK